MLAALAGYCAVAEGTAALRRREYWMSAALAIAVAIPFAVQSFLGQGHPLSAWTAAGYMMPEMSLTARASGLAEGLRVLLPTLGWVFVALLAGGSLWLLHTATLGRGRGDAGTVPQGGVLLLLWMLLPILYFCLFVRPVLDRYLVLALPPAFLTIGYATTRLTALARQWHPVASMAVIGAVLAFGTLRFMPLSDAMIRDRATSFAGLQEAGLWIREVSDPADLVLSRSVAQVTYYAERSGETIPDDRADFAALMAARRPRYVVVSAYEPHPAWILNTRPEFMGLRVVASFPRGRSEAVVLESVGVR